jgi:hypothetical protein
MLTAAPDWCEMIASRRSPCAVPAGFAIEIDADGWLALAEDDDRTTGEPGVGEAGRMARLAARVGERVTGLGEELPVEVALAERQLQYAIRVVVSDLAVRLGRPKS